MTVRENQSAGSRRLMVLFGMLILLIAIASLSGVFSSDVSTIEPPTIAINSDDVATISMRADGQKIEIARDGESWVLTEPIPFPADQNRVDGLLRSLASVELGALVTESSDRHDVYFIGDSSGLAISLTSKSGDSSTYYLGGKAVGQRGDYLRLSGDPRVFKLAQRVFVASDPELWRDKQIVPAAAGTAKTVAVRSPEASYSLSSDRGWSFDDGGAADSVKVDQFVSRYANLRADAFLDSLDASAVRADASYQVTLATLGGAAFDVFFQPLDDEEVAVATGAMDAVYRIRFARLPTLVPERAELEATN